MRTSFLLAVGLVAGCGDNNEVIGVLPGPDGLFADACTPGSAHATVTRGVLTMDETQRAVVLDMAPVLERSLLVYSVRHAEASPKFGAVLCELVPEDTVAQTPAALACRHESMGTDSVPAIPVTIQWQVITFDEGTRVQRGVIDTSPQSPQNIALAAVDPTKSFVVLGGAIGGGTGWGNNDFALARLTSGTNLEIRHETPGSIVSWQVVELPGAKVVRGTTSLGTIETMKTVDVETVPANSILLATHTNNNVTATVASSLMVQAQLTSPTALALNRSQGGTAVEAAYEIITLPFTTMRFTTTLAAAETTKSQPVDGLGAATGVAFSTMQAASGQSTGSTGYADPVTPDLVGEASATFTVSDGEVSVRRATAASSAAFSWNVIDFAKPACD